MVATISYNWRLNIVATLFFTFYHLAIPLIPRYASTMGLQPSAIGFAISSLSITAIVLRPLGGSVSDKWSRIKPMTMGTLLLSVAYVMLAFSRNLGTLIASGMLQGIAAALFIPSSIASAIDYAPEGRVGEALGWRSLAVGVGLSLGPALGGFMAELLGYNYTFMVTSLLALTIIPLLATCKEPPRRRTSNPMKRYRVWLKNSNFLLAFLGLTMYSSAWMGLLTFLSAYLKIRGYGDLEMGLFVAIQAAMSLVTRPLAGRIADVRASFMTSMGLLIMSASLFAIYLLEVPPLLYVASSIFGLGVGIYLPSSQTLALAKAPLEGRGFLSGTYTMGMDVGRLIGPTAFGIIIEISNSYQVAFLIAPFLPLIPAIALLSSSLRTENHTLVSSLSRTSHHRS